MNQPETSDEGLGEAIARGDASAAETLGRLYAGSLYDFAIRTTLDGALAASSVEVAFRRAVEGMADKSGLSVRSWLFALTRDEALDGIRQRGSADAGPENTAAPISPVDERFIQSSDASVDEELALWAWQAARGQRPRDYCFLDLLLRRKLAPQEVADLGSLSRTGVYGVIGRLRGAFEESFLTSALYYRGRERCAELDELIKRGAGLAPALRREISHHAESCDACKVTRAALPAAAGVFAGLSEVEPLAEQRQHLVASITIASTAAVAAAQARGDESLPISTGTSSDPVEAEDGHSSDYDEEPLADQGETASEAGEEAEDENFLPVRAAFEGLEAEPRALESARPPDDDSPSDPDPAPVPAGAPPGAAAAGSFARDPRRIQFSGDVVFGMPPPRRPWQRVAGWFNDDERRKTVLFTLLGAMTVGFAYLGFVLGSSIEGGGGDGGEIPPLPTRTANVCGEMPTTLDQGSRATLTFDQRSLPNYQISAVSVRGASANASQQAVEARSQPGLSVQFEALPAPGPSGRTDEYKLLITFARGDETTMAECTVFVKAPVATATSTSAPVSPTPAATATRTPAPVVPTSPPVIQPTTPPPPPPPTAIPTQAFCTPTPQPPPIATSPPIPFPTFTPVPVPCP